MSVDYSVVFYQCSFSGPDNYAVIMHSVIIRGSWMKGK